MKKIPVIISFTGFILIWEICIVIFKIPMYILPPPSSIAMEFYNKPAYLFSNFMVTFFETAAGFIIGTFCAFCLAIIFSQSKTLKDACMPYLVSLKVIPSVILAPLIIIWFGHALFSKIIITALACFLPVLVNMIRGLNFASQTHIDLFKILGASKIMTLIHLQIPSSLPYLFSALKISSTLAVLGAVVGELIGSNSGLGYLMAISSAYLDTPILFAAILLSGAIGVILYFLVAIIEKWMVFWRE